MPAWRLVKLLPSLLLVAATLLSPLGCYGEVTITVKTSPSDTGINLEFVSNSRSISLAPGKDYIIDCGIGNAGTFPNIPWAKDSVDLPEMASPSGSNPQAYYQRKSFSERYLHLYQFDSSLEGNYTCSSTVDAKHLIISSNNPSIVVDKVSIDPTDNNGFFLKVGSYGNPAPDLTGNNHQWLLNGSPLDTSGVSITYNSGTKTFTFSFTNLDKSYAGTYTLEVTTSAGTGNASFTIMLFTTPVVQFNSSCSSCLKGFDLFVSVDNNFTLSCIETVSTPVPVLTWFENSEVDPENLLQFDEYVSLETVTSTESRLSFTNIPLSHAGQYGCKANNTKFKDFKVVNVIVEYPPQVTPISPSTINVSINKPITILVSFNGALPTPWVNWTYTALTDTTQQPLLPSNRVSFSGNYSMNLTINATTSDDAGTYTLTTGNKIGVFTYVFTVNIQIPATLIMRSSSSIHRAVGGSARFEVDIQSANPPVTSNSLNWEGNFDTDRANITFKNSRALLILSDLKLNDAGSVTLTSTHPAGDTTISFTLVVLNPPSPPLSPSIMSTDGSCYINIQWTMPVSTPGSQTAPADQVQIDYRKCAYNDQSCDQPWEILTHHPSHVTSCTVSLAANLAYSFRLTGCSNLYGCGTGQVIQSLVETNVIGFEPRVSNFNLRPFNSSSIIVSWRPPTEQTDCYVVSSYGLSCYHNNHTNIVYSNTVPVSTETDSYSLVLHDLEPNNEYNCSMSIGYEDLKGGLVQLNAPPIYASNFTYPSLSMEKEFMLTFATNKYPPSLDLSGIGQVYDINEISFVHIAVLRLGTSLTVPSESPDTRYPSRSDFSTYEDVHSVQDKINYRPYIAAELRPDNIPRTFVIGSDDVTNTRKRQQSNDYTNGPLTDSNYYTFFIRVYAKSTFLRDQYGIFTSSSFTGPYKVDREDGGSVDDSSSGGSSGGIVAGVLIALLITIAIVAAIVILFVLVYRNRRGKRRQTIPVDDTSNGHALPMNEYSDLSEVKGGSSSPSPDEPPQLPSTDPPKKKPTIQVANALFGLEEHGGSQESTEPEKDEETDADKRSVSIHLDSTPSSMGPTPRHGSPISPASICEKPRTWSQPVGREEFQSHLDRLDEDDQRLFEKDFLYIQTHSTEHPAEASTRAFMHGKNRYKNVTAFDYTRVVLSEVKDVPNSDYINANYIKGYDEHKLYIATQGPTEETHVDFWRMVWEQRTTTIVMLTNLEEKGKPKCHKYWPSHGGTAYGNIVVRKDRDIVLPFYTIRSFKLIDVSFSERERTVIQFHYTAWPDKNVPAQASPLLDFLRAINTANDSIKHGPMVIHCSAGVGRTGTIIALDICLDQLKTEGRVDVGSVVSFLREQRTQMVQTTSQYIFIHHAILEDIAYGDSTVLLKNFPEKYLKLQANHCALIREENDKIGLVRPPAQANSKPRIVCTNVEDEEGDRDDSFPAFVVDGYWYHNLFLACQMCPTPENQELFWRLIWQEGCSHIINISQKSYGLYVYLPDTGESKSFGEVTVTVDRMEYKTAYILRYITISTEESKAVVTVKHMQYEDWLAKQLPKTDKFVRFLLECINETHSSEREGHPILVHDSGTMSQVGTFITLLNCCERIKKERLVDLLQTVNRLHLQCPNAIRSMELNHYAYCYDCLHEYCTKLQRETSEPPIYENIASIRGRLQPSPEPIADTPSPQYLNDYEILDDSILGVGAMQK